jgi:ABC-type multidrug transport system fused ATPase/permease subunit
MSGIYLSGLTYVTANWTTDADRLQMGIYAGLGVAQALWTFVIGAVLSFITFFASKALHKAALKRLMFAPMSFVDTNPLGRIMNRFAKGQFIFAPCSESDLLKPS